MHGRKNRLHPGFASCDLLVELLQIVKNLFQDQADTLSSVATVNQKRARPFATPDLRCELFNLSPRCDPFAPRNQHNGDYRCNNRAEENPSHCREFSRSR